MTTLTTVSCELYNGLADSTDYYHCVNPDGENVKIGKSVEYAMTRKM
ncbi:MAG: hypothetical protein J6T70_11480 [Bacteroidales bacterium]|nr:hypothetical protein [Bacteroidales bacterium]